MGDNYGFGLAETPPSSLYKRGSWTPETPQLKTTDGSGGGGFANAAGAFIQAGLMGTNPVAGMMIVLGTQLLGAWLTPEPEQELTPEQKMYKRRIAYFTKLGKSRTAMKHLAAGMSGKPVSYFDKSIGKSDMSDLIDDEPRFAKHVALADSEGA